MTSPKSGQQPGPPKGSAAGNRFLAPNASLEGWTTGFEPATAPGPQPDDLAREQNPRRAVKPSPSSHRDHRWRTRTATRLPRAERARCDQPATTRAIKALAGNTLVSECDHLSPPRSAVNLDDGPSGALLGRAFGQTVRPCTSGDRLVEFAVMRSFARTKRGRSAAVDSDEFHAASRIKLRDYAVEWVERYQGKGRRGFRESTRDDYRRDLRRFVLPFFDGKLRRRVEQVTPALRTSLRGFATRTSRVGGSLLRSVRRKRQRKMSPRPPCLSTPNQSTWLMRPYGASCHPCGLA
jgi:hypothetical protein